MNMMEDEATATKEVLAEEVDAVLKVVVGGEAAEEVFLVVVAATT